MDTSFLSRPIGGTVDEWLDFCHKALELLECWKTRDGGNPFI